jgi:single-strand DNA-binding protein
MDNNELRIRGNVATNPTQVTVASGHKITTFRLGSNHRRFDKAANDWVTTESLFITVNCWRQLGDNVYASLHRGDFVDVRGRLRQRDYDDKDGKQVTVFELEAYSVGPDLGRYIVTMARPPRQVPETPVQAPAADGVVPEQSAPAETNPWNEPAQVEGEAA